MPKRSSGIPSLLLFFVVADLNLELLFGQTIDWPQVFAQLGGMWEGEYGPWLTQTFFA